MSKRHLYLICIATLLTVGAALRFAGLTRGVSDFVLPHQADTGQLTAFYQFHPDEETLVRSALEPIEPRVPPYTSWGLLPNYVLRCALLAFGWENAELSNEANASRVYILARLLAATLSCGTLVCTWLMGKRYCNRWATLVGLSIVTFSPGAVQQAHFYIVDGYFSLLNLLATWAILHTAKTRERRWYLLSGLLIGALGAVRFNGLALGLVLFIGHMWGHGGWQRNLKNLFAGNLWLAGAAASSLFIALHPFLLLNPDVVAKDEGRGDFATAINWALNQTLQPWTLKDVDSVIFWDHWFELWPLITTWPLTLALSASIVYVISTRQIWSMLALACCAIYFIPIGFIPVKAIRHLVPILPFVALFTGMLCTAASGRYRRVIHVSALVSLAHIALTGVAFSRIYTIEDSRIQAGRWIRDYIEAGNHIALENGAFSMSGLIDSRRHPHTSINLSRLFYLQPYQLCSNQIDYFHRRLLSSNYVAIIDANRAAQFTAVPQLFPVASEFYLRLIDGQLGFELIQRFKVYPELAGLKIIDDNAVPDYLGYDHPAVLIFRRRDTTHTNKAFVDWKKKIRLNEHCPDRGLQKITTTLRSGRIREAQAMTEIMAVRHDNTRLLQLIDVEAFRIMGRDSLTHARLEPIWPENITGLMSHVNNPNTIHYIPASLAQSAATLGLTELALHFLEAGIMRYRAQSPKVAKEMAESYRSVANHMRVEGATDAFEHSLTLSMKIHPDPMGLNILAQLALQNEDRQRVVSLLRQSLAMDPTQARVHASFGAALLQSGRAHPAEALSHLQTAIELDNGLEPSLRPMVIDALRMATGDAD